MSFSVHLSIRAKLLIQLAIDSVEALVTNAVASFGIALPMFCTKQNLPSKRVSARFSHSSIALQCISSSLFDLISFCKSIVYACRCLDHTTPLVNFKKQPARRSRATLQWRRLLGGMFLPREAAVEEKELRVSNNSGIKFFNNRASVLLLRR